MSRDLTTATAYAAGQLSRRPGDVLETWSPRPPPDRAPRRTQRPRRGRRPATTRPLPRTPQELSRGRHDCQRRPATRPPPRRTPQDTRAPALATSCVLAPSTAYAAGGRTGPGRRDVCELVTFTAYAAGAPGEHDVLRAGHLHRHLHRASSRTHRPKQAQRPATWPAPQCAAGRGAV